VGDDLAAHGGDLAGNGLVESCPHAAVEPALRQVEEQVPDRGAAAQSLEDGQQLGPDAAQRVEAGKQGKESLVAHDAAKLGAAGVRHNQRCCFPLPLWA
jgi:hypothetical protein